MTFMDLSEWRAWWKRQGEDELRAILWEDWDPMGMKQLDPTWPRDEYDMYVPRIAGQLRADADLAAIAALLSEFRTQNMGERPNDEADLAMARRISTWYSRSMASTGDVPDPASPLVIASE
jgi:hypothetical protein